MPYYSQLTKTDGGWSLPVIKFGGPKDVEDYRISRGAVISLGATDPQRLFERFGVSVSEMTEYDPSIYSPGAVTDTLTGITVTRSIDLTLKSDDELRALRGAHVEKHRDAVLAGPIGFTVGGVEYPMSMSLTSQFRTANAANRGVDETWRVSDGSFVPVTAAQLVAMETAMADHIRACFVAQATHVAVLSGLSGQAIIDYPITTGWPATHT